MNPKLVVAKEQIEKVNTFLSNHQTALACVATAVVTHRITYIRTLRGAISGMSETVYIWGHETGDAKARNAIFAAFIESNELDDAFSAFIAGLRE